ncbi:NAD(P)-dependent oxidoreductase [Phaeovulum sp. W22_SRMD_FR3]|uniref:NAD(P)-dependent oxidoreductase n=1 Tax=Phaeovulum sp. W22_SRMD_FR3 TaxID=3240274 RepID=UPI003F955DC4
MVRVAMLEHFAPEVQPQLRALAGADLDLVFSASDRLEDRAAALQQAEYAVVRAVKMPAELLEAAPGLRMIHQWGTGVDGIPVAAARARGIVVARSPGRNAPSVADLTVGLMLACLRRICVGDARIRAGDWAEPDLYDIGRDLSEARVGLVGYGAIARAVEARLAGFDCVVLHSSRSSGLPLEEMLAQVDVVSLHAPATADTRQMINTARIAAMRRGTVLINTARGELVDETALAAALHSGHIAAAGLDAFAAEPLPQDAPLRAAPNTVFSAHSGGRTRENFARIIRHWAGNIRAHAEGRALDPMDLVD